MTALEKGLILAGAQVAMVFSLGGKLLLDRASLPRVWVKTAPVDPNLPIRGRYVSLRLMTKVRGFPPGTMYAAGQLSAEDGKLVARPAEDSNVHVIFGTPSISEPVAYFIPEHVPDPSRRALGEELWVEVTVPRRGPPRPLRLGVKKNGVLTPLE
jgi:uncharacterized membrane-anchored protein